MELHSNGAAAKKGQSKREGRRGEEGGDREKVESVSPIEGTESVISSDADRSDLGSSIIRASSTQLKRGPFRL